MDYTETSSSKAEEKSRSVDRGWAWIVVLGALLINIIYDGCSYSFGIYFPKLLDHFGETKGKTLWIGSLFFSLPLLCGPIAACISRKIGHRKATMTGGLIASLGVACGAFSNSTEMLCITFGLIAGVGMSLPYFNTIIVGAVYFKKKRALATGIAESGAGIGSVIFAPLVSYLISVYGWRGGLLIEGGIVANIMVCGTLFRPVEGDNTNTGREMKESHKKPLTKGLEETQYEKVLKCNHKNHRNKTDEVEKGSNVDNCTVPQSDLYHKYNYEDANLFDINRNISTIYKAESITNNFSSQVETSVDKNAKIPNRRKSINLFSLRPKSAESTQRLCTPDMLDENCVLPLRRYLRGLVRITNMQFVMFCVLNFVMYFWYDVPYVFLVDKTISEGSSDSSAAFLISIIGIVHTIGNIMYGFLGDRKWINRNILFGLSMVFNGLSIVAMSLFTSYLSLAVLAGLFGLFSAANETLCSIVLIDIVGLVHLDKAYGFIMMLQGIANLVGPPVAGWLLDVTGEYYLTFCMSGSWIMTSGLLYLLVPVVKRCLTKRADTGGDG